MEPRNAKRFSSYRRFALRETATNCTGGSLQTMVRHRMSLHQFYSRLVVSSRFPTRFLKLRHSTIQRLAISFFEDGSLKGDRPTPLRMVHAGARSSGFEAIHSEAMSIHRWTPNAVSIVTRRSSGRRCGLERWRGNELNTELGARYSTRWLRSGCPIRTAPGDSATGTGRSAICSGPCNNATLSC